MKISNRAKSALATAGYSVDEGLAISQLAAFAAQNSGIERGNYWTPGDHRPGAWREGNKAFNDECRSISKDWTRFKAALIEAASVGVTDTEVIAEAPHAFSGRLEWRPKQHHDGKTGEAFGEWDYTTGQYFPTEYRKAAAALLEYATRLVRRTRPPESRTITCIAELKALNKLNGGCWFEPAGMRFFGTRIESEIIKGKYFITSEQPPHAGRLWSVRSFDDKGGVNTVGQFCAYGSKAQAMEAVKAIGQEVAA